MSIYDLLKKHTKTMICGIGKNEKGNIYPLIIQEVESYLIKIVLEEVNYNFYRASQILGISRNTLYSKVETLKIPVMSKKKRDK